jgi:hypothetical protein
MEELKDLTMKDLNTLAKISKTYKKLYYDSFGVCGISAEYIQLTAMTFFDLFKENFEIIDRETYEYPLEAKTKFKDVLFRCIFEYSHVIRIEEKFKIDLESKLPNKNKTKYRKRSLTND